MKNMPTEDQPSEAWVSALQAFDADLRRRGAAEKTRRAYGIDLGQFARWASRARASSPTGSPPACCAATPPRCRSAARPRAPWPARSPPLRAFFRSLREHGVVRAEPGRPADLAPSARSGCPQALKPEEVARAARPHPGHDAAGAARPRAVRARLRVRAARRGARLPRRRRRSTSTPRRSGSRARAERPASSPSASTPWPPSSATWTGRGRRCAAGDGERGALPVEVRATPLDVRRAAPTARLGTPCRAARRSVPALAPSLLRHSSARGRGRFAGDSGAARVTRVSPRLRSTLE